ncbi:hypothetical protein Droror1_Dr00026493, partial [Drosera rotundifolia]
MAKTRGKSQSIETQSPKSSKPKRQIKPKAPKIPKSKSSTKPRGEAAEPISVCVPEVNPSEQAEQ